MLSIQVIDKCPSQRRILRDAAALACSAVHPTVLSITQHKRRNCFRFVEVDVCVRATDRDMNCRMWTARQGTNYAINREAQQASRPVCLH